MTTKILIGHPGADHIAFSISRRLYPEAHDFWDGNWLATTVRVRAGGFTGGVAANLRVDEFRAFRMQLESIDTALSGTATLDPMEPWVSLTVACELNGHLTVTCTMDDHPAVGNQLRCTIGSLDQTDLPPIINQLNALEARLPVRDAEI